MEQALCLAKQGLAPETIALCVALGFVFGVFPVFGCPTIFCLLAALALRLNLPAIQFVNYLVYPLQLALLIPFVRLGDRLLQSATPQVGGVFGVLTSVLHAIVGWFCVSVPLGLILYVFVGSALRRSREPLWNRP